MTGQPRATPMTPVQLVVFHCDGGSLATQHEPPRLAGAGFVRVPCVGRLSVGDLLQPLRRGATGVLVAGCRPEACRFDAGASFAEAAVTRVAALLETLGHSTPVRYAAVGGGAALVNAAAELIADCLPAEAGWASIPRASGLETPWSHHGAVRAMACLANRPPDREGDGQPGGGDVLYGCDLPWLDAALGPAFAPRAAETLAAASVLVGRLGLDARQDHGLPACGHDLAYQFAEKPLAVHLRRAARRLKGRAERLIVLCPECEQTLGRMVAEDGELPEIVGLLDLLAAAPRDWLRPVEKVRLSLLAAPGDSAAVSTDVSRELLEASGAEVLVLPSRPTDHDQGACGSGVCGFGPCDAASRRAQDALLAAARSAEVDRVLTLSPRDAIHLRCAQRQGAWRGAPVSVLSVIDYLAGVGG